MHLNIFPMLLHKPTINKCKIENIINGNRCKQFSELAFRIKVKRLFLVLKLFVVAHLAKRFFVGIDYFIENFKVLQRTKQKLEVFIR